MVKSGTWNDADGDGFADPGDTISYEFLVTNNGNVTLSSVAVADPLVDPVTCPQDTLAVDESMTCTASYTITQVDIDAGQVYNAALATGEGPQGQPVEDPGDNTEPLPQNSAHSLTKTFIPNPVGEGDIGTFELEYENTGNVTLTNVDITDNVDERLVVQDEGTSTDAVCSDHDDDVQTILCEVDSLAPGESVTITVTFIALGDDFDGIGGEIDQTSGANYVFYFANGYVLYGSTETGEATLLDENRDPVTDPWSVEGANQDIYFVTPYDDLVNGDLGFFLHLSCSEAFIGGWGSTGPIEGVDHADWQVDAYDVYRFNSQGFLKDCAQTFPFDVPNTATASATPPTGAPALADATASDTLEVVNIAPIEVTRDRVRRGDVEIQYFNTSYEDLVIDIIRVEWNDPSVQLEYASYQDGVDLGISGSSPAQASISTLVPDRSKDWLKLSFDSGDAPEGLTVTIVTDEGATFTYVYGS